MPKQISENKRNMILNGNLSQAILMLAVPVMINSFIQSMYNLTDTFWLGRIGTENQSAITLVSPFQNILNSFGSGITTAGAILISQYLGARKDEQANKMANHICITSLGFSLICALLCWLISPALVNWLGARGVVYEYGLTYLRIVVLDMPFLFMINLFTAVKQAQGDTVKPMLLNLLGIMINLILDPLFLIVFHFGIGGAAFATLIAKIPCALIGQKQRRKPRKYTDEFKQQLVELYRSGKRRCDICREYDIATSLFDKWVKQASNSGSFHEKDNRTPEQEELIRLRKENQQLRMENDILKQAALILGRK